jgi:DNA repair protein RecO (recombination protein O)
VRAEPSIAREVATARARTTRSASTGRSITTHALLLKRVIYSESDLVVTLLTQERGRVSALARGARSSRKRFGGALEPMHTLSIRLEETHGELALLREANLATVRTRLTADLSRLEAAGKALGWVRRAAPAHTPEPAVWRVISDLLDELNLEQVSPPLALAEAGLSLLRALGWGLDFERCVRCGKPCEPTRAALLSASLGGLVCNACGGGPTKLSGALRDRLSRATLGEHGSLSSADAGVALDLVERALRAHGGLE